MNEDHCRNCGYYDVREAFSDPDKVRCPSCGWVGESE